MLHAGQVLISYIYLLALQVLLHSLRTNKDAGQIIVLILFIVTVSESCNTLPFTHFAFRSCLYFFMLSRKGYLFCINGNTMTFNKKK